MSIITFHPNVYTTGNLVNLRYMLEDIWVRNHQPGEGTFFIISGFANFNGGARFYRVFREHTDAGGKVIAFLGGSSSQRLSSKQVVEALVDSGVEVNIVNRKRILHAKCYGIQTQKDKKIIISSGNFTGPGMSQNIEASVLLNNDELMRNKFQWDELVNSFRLQKWMMYNIHGSLDVNDPAWKLLYDEYVVASSIDESEEVTLVLLLGHADTSRIQAVLGTNQSKGTQYFWLSKDNFDFFPPLTIRNLKGIKGTLSALVTLHYVDIKETNTQCRVTFEAENNFDFRIGTGRLRNTQLADKDDIACISRVGEAEYKLRIINQSNSHYNQLSLYATTFTGNKGKRYGYIDNTEFEKILNINLSTSPYS